MRHTRQHFGRLAVAFTAIMGIFLAQWAVTSCKEVYTTPIVQEVYGLKFMGHNDSVLHLQMMAIVKNENTFGATVEALESKMYIKEAFIGNSSNTYGFKLKGNDTTHIVIDAQINLLSFAALYPELLSMDSIEVKFDGLFNIGLPVTKKTLEMRKQAKFNMPAKSLIAKQINDMLSAQGGAITFVLPPKLKTVSSAESQLLLDVQIKNTFPFAYEIRGMDMDLFLAGATDPSGHWTLNDTIQIEAGQIKTTTIEVTLQNQSLMQQAFQNIMRGGFDLRKATTVSAKGTVSVFVANYPFEIPVEIEKSAVEFMK